MYDGPDETGEATGTDGYTHPDERKHEGTRHPKGPGASAAAAGFNPAKQGKKKKEVPEEKKAKRKEDVPTEKLTREEGIKAGAKDAALAEISLRTSAAQKKGLKSCGINRVLVDAPGVRDALELMGYDIDKGQDALNYVVGWK